MIRQDLDILQELFLPLLEEMTSYSPLLADHLGHGDAFWVEFNNAIVDTDEQLRKFFIDHEIKDIGQYSARIENLRNEYITWNAQCLCAGKTNPTITLLTEKAHSAFMEEVAFQNDMLTAMALAGREAIKNELALFDEFAGTDISTQEISAAFSALHRDAQRNELRKQLQQWDEDQPAQHELLKRRKRRAIPLLFMRFAAAAAVGTVATVGIIKVYDNRSRDNVPAANYNSALDSNGITHNPAEANTDTTLSNKADAPVISNTGGGNKGANHNAAHLPQIILKGIIIDTATNELVTDVEVTMVDDKGNKQTLLSKDGNFRFVLPLRHDLVITGKKENYHSATISLSTKDVKDTDADDVIDGTLRLTKDL